MFFLNFSHPLTAKQQNQIENSLGRAIEYIWQRMPQFDHNVEFPGQIQALVEQVELSAVEWQTTPILLNLPGYAPAAACVLAEIHGRCGYFPAIVRLRPIAGSTPVQYELAEIINLQQIRDIARTKRQEAES